jgi:hypothetical protein
VASPDPGARIRTSGDPGGLVLDDSDLVDGGHLAEHGEQVGLGHVLGHLAHEELHALLLLRAAASLLGLLAVLRHWPARVPAGAVESLPGSSSSRRLSCLAPFRLVAQLFLFAGLGGEVGRRDGRSN